MGSASNQHHQPENQGSVNPGSPGKTAMENSNLCCPEVNANTKLLNAETKADGEGRDQP